MSGGEGWGGENRTSGTGNTRTRRKGWGLTGGIERTKTIRARKRTRGFSYLMLMGKRNYSRGLIVQFEEETRTSTRSDATRGTITAMSVKPSPSPNAQSAIINLAT